MNFSALYTILVTFGPVTQEFTLLTITPFAAKLQNRHITPNISEYPGPILTYFTSLVVVLVWLSRYSFGGCPRDVAMATS